MPRQTWEHFKLLAWEPEDELTPAVLAGLILYERPHEALGYATPAEVSTLIPALTVPNLPDGKQCSPRDQGRSERLEVRPPAAVSIGTRRKRRGRTGSAKHGSFSHFQMVLERRMNDRQTKATVAADHENPSYFLRSVV